MSPEALAATAQNGSPAVLSPQNKLSSSKKWPKRVPMFVPLSTSALLIGVAHIPEGEDVKNSVCNLCPKKMTEQLMDWRNSSMFVRVCGWAEFVFPC